MPLSGEMEHTLRLFLLGGRAMGDLIAGDCEVLEEHPGPIFLILCWVVWGGDDLMVIADLHNLQFRIRAARLLTSSSSRTPSSYWALRTVNLLESTCSSIPDYAAEALK